MPVISFLAFSPLLKDLASPKAVALLVATPPLPVLKLFAMAIVPTDSPADLPELRKMIGKKLVLGGEFFLGITTAGSSSSVRIFFVEVSIISVVIYCGSIFWRGVSSGISSFGGS